MKLISQVIDQLLLQAQENWELKLRAEWSTIMGDLARRARLERINDTTLILGVYDSHWIHELHALSRMILQRVNSALSTTYPAGFSLKALRCIWVQKKIYEKKYSVSSTHGVEKKIQPYQRRLSLKMLKKIQHLSSTELQDSLISYYIRCKQEDDEK